MKVWLLGFLLWTSAGGQANVGPEAFVRRLYQHYAWNDDFSTVGLDRSALNEIFSAPLVALILSDRSRTPKGDAGALDFEPICECQDSEGLRIIELRIEEDSVYRAKAIVSLAFGSSTRTQVKVELSLRKGTAGWRVDDVASGSMSSLRRLLRDDEAAARLQKQTP